jgi:hypothetical protein
MAGWLGWRLMQSSPSRQSGLPDGRKIGSNDLRPARKVSVDVQFLRDVLAADLDLILVLADGVSGVLPRILAPAVTERPRHALRTIRPPKAFVSRIAISGLMPALPLTMLLRVRGVTPRILAPAVTERPRHALRTIRPGCAGFFMGMSFSPWFPASASYR